jgi:hypothetical protein
MSQWEHLRNFCNAPKVYRPEEICDYVIGLTSEIKKVQDTVAHAKSEIDRQHTEIYLARQAAIRIAQEYANIPLSQVIGMIADRTYRNVFPAALQDKLRKAGFDYNFTVPDQIRSFLEQVCKMAEQPKPPQEDQRVRSLEDDLFDRTREHALTLALFQLFYGYVVSQELDIPQNIQEMIESQWENEDE